MQLTGLADDVFATQQHRQQQRRQDKISSLHITGSRRSTVVLLIMQYIGQTKSMLQGATSSAVLHQSAQALLLYSLYALMYAELCMQLQLLCTHKCCCAANLNATLYDY